MVMTNILVPRTNVPPSQRVHSSFFERGEDAESRAAPLQGAPGPESSSPKVSHAALLLAGQAARWLLRLAFVLAAARTLGPEKFGVYALLFAVTEFAAVASGSGYADYLTREAARNEALGWGLAAQLASLRMLLAVPIAAAEIAILHAMRYPHSILAGAAWMSLSLAPRSWSEAVQGVLRGTGRLAGYLAVDLVLGGSLVAGAVLLTIGHAGLGTAIAAELTAAGAAGIAGAVLAAKRRASLRLTLPGLALLKRGAIFNLYSFIGSLYDRFDVVLLSKLAGDYATGIYSVAYRALGMTQIVAYGVLYSLLPALSRDMASQCERRRLERAVGMLLSAAFVVVLGTLVFAGPAVRMLLGPRYAEAAVVLKLLIWAVIVRYVNYALNIALLAGRQERVFVVTSSVCLAVNLAGNLLLIPRYGWRAAAYVTIATELVLLAQNVYWIRRTLGGIPLPQGLVRTSLAFAAGLAATLFGNRSGMALPIGSASLLFFAAYLYRSGAVTEFAEVWSVERSASA